VTPGVRKGGTEALLGIDLGTSQVKALLCAPDGTILGRGAAGYDITAPREGWAESDPEQWWRAVRTAVRQAAPAEVSAIALTGQMHGVILSNERTLVPRPAILWLDRRASAEALSYDRLSADQLESLANAPWPGTAGPVLRWLSAHEPDVYRSARWQLQPKDWLRFRLTGEAATDPTDASGTLLYDMARDQWAFDVAAALGVRADLLAPIRSPDSVAGELLGDVAAELGLRAGIPVATGCADTAASLLAAGLPEAEWALLTLGTGGQWIVPAGGWAGDGSGRTNVFRAVEGWYRLAGAQNVGVTLDWVRRMLNATWDDVYSSAASASGGGGPSPDGGGPPPDGGAARSPLFAPWLVEERGKLGGGWSGVTLRHGREDLLRAALTGVADLLRDRLSDLHAVGCVPEKVLLGGGGSQYQPWRELLAAVVGLPLYPAPTPWLSARGAVLLAARAASRA
jgi:xylulokinase